MQRVTVPALRVGVIVKTMAKWPQRVTIKRQDGSVLMQTEGYRDGNVEIFRGYYTFRGETLDVIIEHKVAGAGDWIPSSDRVVRGGGDRWTLFTVQSNDSGGDGDFNDCVVYFEGPPF
jgi:hypothetical protein